MGYSNPKEVVLSRKHHAYLIIVWPVISTIYCTENHYRPEVTLRTDPHDNLSALENPHSRLRVTDHNHTYRWSDYTQLPRLHYAAVFREMRTAMRTSKVVHDRSLLALVVIIRALFPRYLGNFIKDKTKRRLKDHKLLWFVLLPIYVSLSFAYRNLKQSV
jgi:hypothetical protein